MQSMPAVHFYADRKRQQGDAGLISIESAAAIAARRVQAKASDAFTPGTELYWSCNSSVEEEDDPGGVRFRCRTLMGQRGKGWVGRGSLREALPGVIHISCQMQRFTRGAGTDQSVVLLPQ